MLVYVCAYVCVCNTHRFMYAYVSVYNTDRFICVHMCVTYIHAHLCICMLWLFFVLFCTLLFSFNDETLWMSSVSDY